MLVEETLLYAINLGETCVTDTADHGNLEKDWKLTVDGNVSYSTGDVTATIDLFRLYILFSQYRSCDDTQEI